MTKQRMQQIYDGVQRKHGLELAGTTASTSSVRSAFVEMRQVLDVENASEEEKRAFASTIQKAINEGIWRVADHRTATSDLLKSAFTGAAQETTEQVVSLSLKPVKFE